MKVAAIDPGNEKSAIVIYDDGGEGLDDLSGASIEMAEIVPNLEMLDLIAGLEGKGIPLYIEMVSSMGMRVGMSVFETCLWIGQFYMAARAVLPVVCLVKRIDVKHWHTGRTACNDAAVSSALKEKYGEKGTKADPGLTFCLTADKWQAFALAAAVSEGCDKVYVPQCDTPYA